MMDFVLKVMDFVLEMVSFGTKDHGSMPWLKSPELQADVGEEVLTLVMHGAFIDILVKAILGAHSSTQLGHCLPNS